MVFSSLFFVFLFLPLNLLVYRLVHGITKKNIVMLTFSIIFYAWAGPEYVLLLLAMVLIAWLGALAVTAFDRKRIALGITIALMLFLIGYFKYAGFILTQFHNLFGMPEIIPEIVLPIGISFYTFQLISYVVDVFRGEVKPQRKYWLLLLYASLFHQCIAGPIVRYKDVQRDILHRKVKNGELAQGIKRFCIGLAKKAILANGCAVIADTFLLTEDITAMAQVPALGIWLGELAFCLEIYLDFSAYSDMAIGMGLMIGFHYRENFNYPYVSGSVTEFWRRWHISLGSFFRDYVYIPLGGSRVRQSRWVFNLLVVWFLTGLWHGASWNYIFWGLYMFAFLLIERLFLNERLKRLPVFISHVYLLAAIYFSFIIFKFEDLRTMGVAFKGLFGLNGNAFTNMTVGLTFKNYIFFLIFAIAACTPLFKWIYNRVKQFSARRGTVPYLIYIYDIVAPVVLLVLSTFALVGNSYNPFLYFRF